MIAPRGGQVVAWSVEQGKPDASELQYFNDRMGGAPSARIAVLRPGSDQRYTLVEQGPVENLKAFFGENHEFRLDRPLDVRKGDVLAITVPTWAAALVVDRSKSSSWRSSRPKSRCEDTKDTTHSSIGSSTRYGCSHELAFPKYSASLR